MSQAHDISKLRQMLKERFPSAHARQPDEELAATQVECLDDIGLPKGAITEVVASESQGGHLLVSMLLEKTEETGQALALVDGKDSFDPQTAMPNGCERLLWVRCQTAMEAVKASDILLRDGNLRFVILDLCLNEAKELRRLNSAVWFRLQTLAQQTSSVFMVLTPHALVGSARLRLQLDSSFQLRDLDHRPDRLMNKIRIKVTRQRNGRLQVGVEAADEDRLAG